MSFFGNQGQSRKRHEESWRADAATKQAEVDRVAEIDAQNAAAREASAARRAGGRASTILTSEEGDTNDPFSAKKKLLGV